MTMMMARITLGGKETTGYDDSGCDVDVDGDGDGDGKGDGGDGDSKGDGGDVDSKGDGGDGRIGLLYCGRLLRDLVYRVFLAPKLAFFSRSFHTTTTAQQQIKSGLTMFDVFHQVYIFKICLSVSAVTEHLQTLRIKLIHLKMALVVNHQNTNVCFIDTNISTRFITMFSDSDKVSDLNEKIILAHYECYPEFKYIEIECLKLKQFGNLYRVPGSVTFKDLYLDGKRDSYHLFVDIESKIVSTTAANFFG
ncbi:uncharacterized protein [Rutidosis leptorrhynchoides]|uniref:uncharacterized protein n=1 Tax=Rutidosis leptorrhynchoides TaxID=125765 RepID=UPI003A992D5F